MLRNFLIKLFWILISIVLALRVYPVTTRTLLPSPRPSQSYEESLQRIQALTQQDSPAVSPDGRLIFMGQGEKTARVIVFFHGFTNSPRQFKSLGDEFHKRGYNVLIPRIPHHGLKDRMGADLIHLTAEELKETCDEAVDIARGLGDHITVAGLSMGGVMAGWAAQFRDDVDLAVLISPNFGTYRAPAWFSKQTISFLSLWPNRFIWWDPRLKTAAAGPESAYYGFSSKALGEIRRLGWIVQTQGQKYALRAGSVLVITNANDSAVNKRSIDMIRQNWQKHSPQKIRRYEFPPDLLLGHDLIDPQQPGEKIRIVYPQILKLITAME